MPNNEQTVFKLWENMDKQNWQHLHIYFAPDAIIKWPGSNELFTVDEFVTANEQYPGDWNIKVEKLLSMDSMVISVVCVSLTDSNLSYHASSFFQFRDGLIESLDEYWGQDEAPPQWRAEMGIGRPLIR